MYRKAMGRPCNLKRPMTFNEKVSWLKLYELPNDPLASLVADKYSVRDWVVQKGHGDILVKLFGVWESVDDISVEDLPEKFALKCNHGCGMNVICDDKSRFNAEEALRKLNEWMHTDWALLSAEPHYSAIERKVICEEYVEGPLVDYKFFCFQGVPQFYYVSEGFDRGLSYAKVSFFSIDGTPAPFRRLDHAQLPCVPESKPLYFDEMVSVAKGLSSSFKFARIDFLTNEGGFYFSEVTLTPCAGMMPLEPREWDYKLGEMLVI